MADHRSVHHKRTLSNGRPAPIVERADRYPADDVDALSVATQGLDPERLKRDVERLRREPPKSDTEL